MVEAEEVEDGGVQVVDVDLVLDGADAVLVGRVAEAAFDAAAGGHMAGGVVVAAVGVLGVRVRPNSPPQTTSVSLHACPSRSEIGQ